LRCPYCNNTESQVKDSRPDIDDSTIRRRRICSACGAKFITIERIILRDFSVHKSNGSLEPFDREKLKKSIKISCRKRNISEEQIEKLVNSIHRRLETENSDSVIPSETIGQMVLESLLNLDAIAFVRFASVYNKFSRISDFKKLLNTIPETDAVDSACELPKHTGRLL
jgi:transcriptional repressor NrdR